MFDKNYNHLDETSRNQMYLQDLRSVAESHEKALKDLTESLTRVVSNLSDLKNGLNSFGNRIQSAENKLKLLEDKKPEEGKDNLLALVKNLWKKK